MKIRARVNSKKNRGNWSKKLKKKKNEARNLEEPKTNHCG